MGGFLVGSQVWISAQVHLSAQLKVLFLFYFLIRALVRLNARSEQAPILSPNKRPPKSFYFKIIAQCASWDLRRILPSLVGFDYTDIDLFDLSLKMYCFIGDPQWQKMEGWFLQCHKVGWEFPDCISVVESGKLKFSTFVVNILLFLFYACQFNHGRILW